MSGDVAETGDRKRVYRRMISMERDGEVWAFAADEVCGIVPLGKEQLTVDISEDVKAATYATGATDIDGRTMIQLDDQLIFQSLARSIR